MWTGCHLLNMRQMIRRDKFLQRLKKPNYAAKYLAQVLEEEGRAAFLLALKEVVEAAGGMGHLARKVDIRRQSLYKILSKNGNPTLATLQEILEALGMRISVVSGKQH